MKEALKTVQSHQTMVLKTQIGDNFWYEVASEAQAHLLTRTITKLVNDTSTTDDVVQKANEQGLLMKALKHNLICLFKTVIEHRIEPLYLPAN